METITLCTVAAVIGAILALIMACTTLLVSLVAWVLVVGILAVIATAP